MMRALQKELDELRGARSRDNQRAREDEEELMQLRAKLELGGGMTGGVRISFVILFDTYNFVL